MRQTKDMIFENEEIADVPIVSQIPVSGKADEKTYSNEEINDLPVGLLEGTIPVSAGHTHDGINSEKVLEGTIIVGGTMKSAYSGARALFFPDANTGFQVIDDAGDDVFKTIVGGTDVGDVIIGNHAGGAGCKYDKSAGTFDIQGILTAGSIHIPDQTTANSFHTETDGDSWWGCNVADWALSVDNAKAYIFKDGTAKFSNDVTIGDYAGGQGIFYDQSAGTIHYAGVTSLKTFFQDGIPTSENIGDLWFDTDDDNAPYRAAIVGADQIVAGEWESCENPTEWASVGDGASTKPDNNATEGATIGTDLEDEDANTPTQGLVVNFVKYTAGQVILVDNLLYLYGDKVYPTCGACSISTYNFIGVALENIAKDATGKVQRTGVVTGLGAVDADTPAYIVGNETPMHSETTLTFTEKIGGTTQLGFAFENDAGAGKGITSVEFGITKVGNPGDLTIQIYSSKSDGSGHIMPDTSLLTLTKKITEREVRTAGGSYKRVYLDMPYIMGDLYTYYFMVLSAASGDVSANYYNIYKKASPINDLQATTDDWATKTNKGTGNFKIHRYSQDWGQVSEDPIGVNGTRIFEVGYGVSSQKLSIQPIKNKYWRKVLKGHDYDMPPSEVGKMDFRIGFRAKKIKVTAYDDEDSYFSEGEALVGVSEDCRWLDGSNNWNYEKDEIIHLYCDANNRIIGSLSNISADLDNMKFTIDFANVDYGGTFSDSLVTIIIEAWS